MPLTLEIASSDLWRGTGWDTHAHRATKGCTMWWARGQVQKEKWDQRWKQELRTEHRSGRSSLEMEQSQGWRRLDLAAIHIHRPEGEQSGDTGSPGEESPPCLSCTTLTRITLLPQSSHRKTRVRVSGRSPIFSPTCTCFPAASRRGRI